MMGPETRQYVLDHRQDDVRVLALKGARHPDIDLTFALDQIAGWQTARRKLPSWAAHDEIVYPPKLSMEQCSSEQTALYKTAVVSRLLSSTPAAADSFLDLTGGLGVDFSFIAPAFQRAVYVEQQEHLCAIARQNFQTLGLTHAEVVHGDGVEQLHAVEQAGLIFLDPARRDSHGSRTFAIADCLPDVTLLREELLQKAKWVLLKLSPMLDWHQAVRQLGQVAEVHIVAVGNECKELLLVLSAQASSFPQVYCVNDDTVFSFQQTPDKGNERATVRQAKAVNETKMEGEYLYEPNASIMKAGCFDLLARRFPVTPISTNSHLFISSNFIEEFPGRKFRIKGFSSMNKKELKALLPNIRQANIAVRNFPLSAADLRKRLKLSDGGDTYLFGTTTDDGKHVVIAAQKFSDTKLGV